LNVKKNGFVGTIDFIVCFDKTANVDETACRDWSECERVKGEANRFEDGRKP
jgi:hypothetical protein